MACASANLDWASANLVFSSSYVGIEELAELEATALRAGVGSSSSLEELAAREERAFGVKVSSGDGERAPLYGGGATLGVLSFCGLANIRENRGGAYRSICIKDTVFYRCGFCGFPIHHTDLLLVDGRAFGVVNMLPLFSYQCLLKTGLQLTALTIAEMLVNSLSAVTATDWTKNLSLHLASSGGSCFIACKRTTQISTETRPWLTDKVNTHR